jgi:hypothetical protein
MGCRQTRKSSNRLMATLGEIRTENLSNISHKLYSLIELSLRKNGKSQDKFHPITGHEGPEGEKKYCATLSLTSAQDVGGWSKPRPGRFSPEKETWHPLYRRLIGLQGRSGRVRKNSPLPGFDPLSFQSVASRYTDWAIPARWKEW